MKLSKSDLKNIVKECLVEILNEGLAGSLVTSRPATASTLLQHASRPRAIESKHSSPASTPHLREAVRREAGGNKVMESILADTAASTLPKMLEGDRKGYAATPAPGGVVEQVVAAATPEDLFGEDVASKWADLAFSSSPKK